MEQPDEIPVLHEGVQVGTATVTQQEDGSFLVEGTLFQSIPDILNEMFNPEGYSVEDLGDGSYRHTFIGGFRVNDMDKDALSGMALHVDRDDPGQTEPVELEMSDQKYIEQVEYNTEEGNKELIVAAPTLPVTEGDRVLYVLSEADTPEKSVVGEIRPAFVVRVWDKVDGVVNLQVLMDSDAPGTYNDGEGPLVWATSRTYSEGKEPGTWHFPE